MLAYVRMSMLTGSAVSAVQEPEQNSVLLPDKSQQLVLQFLASGKQAKRGVFPRSKRNCVRLCGVNEKLK